VVKVSKPRLPSGATCYLSLGLKAVRSAAWPTRRPSLRLVSRRC